MFGLFALWPSGVVECLVFGLSEDEARAALRENVELERSSGVFLYVAPVAE